MPIGKSKISDMDFGSFKNSIDKNIETDKASDKFDQQLQAYKDAGNTLTLAKSSLETATGSLQEAKDNLVKVTDKADAVTKAIDSFIAKVLEDHRKANKEILTRHFYDMSNMMSRNEGVWLSNGWVKTLLWIFLPCFLYTVISIVYFVASYIDK